MSCIHDASKTGLGYSSHNSAYQVGFTAIETFFVRFVRHSILANTQKLLNYSSALCLQVCLQLRGEIKCLQQLYNYFSTIESLTYAVFSM